MRALRLILLALSGRAAPAPPKLTACAGCQDKARLHQYYTSISEGQRRRQAADQVKQFAEESHQQMALLRKLLANLARKPEEGDRLLDRAMVLNGSNLDDTNLPILLAGGGFHHGQHLTYRRDNNAPLGNLFVSLRQRLGTSTGTVSGL